MWAQMRAMNGSEKETCDIALACASVINYEL